MAFKKQYSITLPDDEVISVQQGTTGAELVHSLSASLAKKTLVMAINGQLRDLGEEFTSNARVTFLTWEDDQGKRVFWHSTAHLLAEALQWLYPHIRLGIGPPTANGFYYDVDFGDMPFDSTHLARIEGKMQALLKQQRSYQRRWVTKKEAIAYFTEHYNPYKLEIIKELKDEEHITFYQQGSFVDLCKGPHLPHTGYIKAIKLVGIAGAYWRGDVAKKQLTRIYGISSPKQSLLKAYLMQREEAKKRDHRTLGKALGFFSLSEKVGKGLPLWLPKGAFVRQKLMRFLQARQEQRGYEHVVTPHIGHKDLYITSGHYDKYRENTFKEIGTPQKDECFLLKPMNCPHHCVIYGAKTHSYKELPIRLAEFGTVYRYEQHGELCGLTRVRSFTQDDAHIFCSADQVKEELTGVIELVLHVFETFKFKGYEVRLSLRDAAKPKHYIGDAPLWNIAEKALREVVAECGLKANIALGEAAFYGPKLDFIVQDALGRQWQLGTVQIDYQLPVRFDLYYIGEDNKKHRPVMIHRAPFGSLERFIAILLEHTAGKLPLWLNPEQVIILPVSALYTNYANKVAAALQKHGVRVRVDERDEKVGRKIREAEEVKVPYMLLVGEREMNSETVSIRKQGIGEQGCHTVKEFITTLKKEGL